MPRKRAAPSIGRRRRLEPSCRCSTAALDSCSLRCVSSYAIVRRRYPARRVACTAAAWRSATVPQPRWEYASQKARMAVRIRSKGTCARRISCSGPFPVTTGIDSTHHVRYEAITAPASHSAEPHVAPSQSTSPDSQMSGLPHEQEVVPLDVRVQKRGVPELGGPEFVDGGREALGGLDRAQNCQLARGAGAKDLEAGSVQLIFLQRYRTHHPCMGIQHLPGTEMHGRERPAERHSHRKRAGSPPPMVVV